MRWQLATYTVLLDRGGSIPELLPLDHLHIDLPKLLHRLRGNLLPSERRHLLFGSDRRSGNFIPLLMGLTQPLKLALLERRFHLK